MKKTSQGQRSSITTGKKTNKVTTSATLFVIEESAYQVMLIQIYDTLMEKGVRRKWLAASTALGGAGLSGLVEWLLNDISQTMRVCDIEWLCPKSVIYGGMTIIALVSLLAYWATSKWYTRTSKDKFVEQYMAYERLDTLIQPYQVSAATLRNPSKNAAILDNSTTQIDERMDA